MLRKSVLIYLLVVTLLMLSAFMQVSPVGAQTPAPGATVVPVKPNVAQVTTSLKAEASTDPALDAMAQEIAQQYGALFGAESTEANVFVMPVDTAFEDIVMAYQAIFDEAGWQVSETANEATETYSTAAWSDGSNVFLAYYKPAAQGEDIAVLVTVGMLAIPDIQGLQALDSETNPELAAIADQIAKSIVEKTGAETKVKIMGFPSTIAIADVIAFYKDGMAMAGWMPVDAFTQVTAEFSSMGWMEGNDMIFIFAGPVSKDPSSDNMLLWITAKLPATGAAATPQATPNN